MTFGTLISAQDAAAHLEDPRWVFVDCTAVLGQPGAGRSAYTEGHLPGAVHADLDADLSAHVVPGRTGRHPLPSEAAFTETAGRLGIADDMQVVAYDASTGAMAAARLWWLLKWAGHESVAVLDGGLAAWRAAGLPTATGSVGARHRTFHPRYRPELVADASAVAAAISPNPAPSMAPAPASVAGDPAAGVQPSLLVDARAEDRFRGENETVDPVAGHIPGAICRPFTANVGMDGRFKPAHELRARFASVPPGSIFYCGSGVTAAHNALAHAAAGLGLPRLYPGSWSEWITDAARPIEH